MPVRNELVEGTYKIKAGDRLPVFEVTLQNHAGAVVDLTDAASATLRLLRRATGAEVENFTMSFVSPRTSGMVRYAWEDEDTDTAGEYRGEVEVVWNTGKSETFPGEGYIPLFFTYALA